MKLLQPPLLLLLLLLSSIVLSSSANNNSNDNNNNNNNNNVISSISSSDTNENTVNNNNNNENDTIISLEESYDQNEEMTNRYIDTNEEDDDDINIDDTNDDDDIDSNKIIDNDIHWKYSKHLNDNNFNSFINEQIYSKNKTVFVRWIAGIQSCGSCNLQSLSWNILIQSFTKIPLSLDKNNTNNVIFGDVNIKDTNINSPTIQLQQSPHNPGNTLYGGWPTIRYFNQHTGMNGSDYIPVASKSMRKWQELSITIDNSIDNNNMYLIDFIETNSNTLLCNVITYTNCNTNMIQYIQSIQQFQPIQYQLLLQKLGTRTSSSRSNSNSTNSTIFNSFSISDSLSKSIWIFEQKYVLLKLLQHRLFT